MGITNFKGDIALGHLWKVRGQDTAQGLVGQKRIDLGELGGKVARQRVAIKNGCAA